MLDAFFGPAFTLWGAPVSGLEALAFGLALATVWCNVRVIHWGWPLAILSSALYFILFWRSKLYGDAALQVFFAVVAIWGWAQWLRGLRPGGSALRVARLGLRGRVAVAASCLLLWPAVGAFLWRFTDTDVPWWDAFPAAASVVGQLLLGLKLIENWAVWLVVNVVSVSLFAYKGLWLTAVLYTLFAGMSVWGWRAWQMQLKAGRG